MSFDHGSHGLDTVLRKNVPLHRTVNAMYRCDDAAYVYKHMFLFVNDVERCTLSTTEVIIQLDTMSYFSGKFLSTNECYPVFKFSGLSA